MIHERTLERVVPSIASLVCGDCVATARLHHGVDKRRLRVAAEPADVIPNEAGKEVTDDWGIELAGFSRMDAV